MIYSLKGKVLLIDGDTVVVDVHDVGYQVLVSHVNEYEVGQEVFLYTYNVVREDEQYLVGFSSLDEWVCVCYEMWDLEKIEWSYLGKAEDVFFYGSWEGPFGNGEVYAEK